MDGIRLAELFPLLGMDSALLTKYLEKHGLRYEPDIDAAFGLFDEDDVLVGCGCAAGDLLKCFAVDESLRGQNALGTLVSALVGNRYARGLSDLFVITRAKNEELFHVCGFYTLAGADGIVMLENRANGPEEYTAQICRQPAPEGSRGAIVMNCNPFTLGHRY